MGRSVLAVILGYAAVIALTIATFALVGTISPDVMARGGPPPAWVYAILLPGAVLAAAGGYISATIARRSAVRHVLALGVVMTLLGVVSMMAHAGQEPLWFQIFLIALPIPATLQGGRWRALQVAGAAR